MELDAYRKMAETEDEHWWFCGRRAIAETIIAGLDLPKGRALSKSAPELAATFPCSSNSARSRPSR